MNFELQPILQNELWIALPLQPEDFALLFKAASDPMIWAQHPNKNRYLLKDFTNYFEGAINSGSAFIIKNKATNEVIGSTRFCNLLQNETTNQVEIGYTFYTRKYWGKNYNHQLKKLLLQHAFQFVDRVQFVIGAFNIPSQQSIERLGAKKIREEIVAYYGEPEQMNFIYQIQKAEWEKKFDGNPI